MIHDRSVGIEVIFKPEGEQFNSQSHPATCFGVLGYDTKTPVLASTHTVWQLSKEQFPQRDRQSINHYYPILMYSLLVCNLNLTFRQQFLSGVQNEKV